MRHPSNIIREKLHILLIIFLQTVVPFSLVQSQIYHVGTIGIDRHTVFDPEDPAEDNLVGSLANSLHVRTREDIIRNELLFSSGDIYDPALVDESERNLRALNYIGDVAIIRDTIKDSTINLKVETYDKWTIGLSASYQQSGGVRNVSLTAKDDNFLGQGQSISLGYNYESDLADPHQYEVIFKEPRLWGSRWGTTMQLKSSQDLRIKTFLLNRLFFSDEATWSASLYADYGHIVVPYYLNGVRSEDISLNQQTHNAYYSRSIGDQVKFRPAIAWVGVTTQGTTLRTNDNLEMVVVSANIMQRRYIKENFLNNHGRVEDVPLGFDGDLLLGKNFYFPHGNEPQNLVQFSWSYAFLVDSIWYFSFSTAASSFLGHASLHEATIAPDFLYYIKIGQRDILTGRLHAFVGIDWFHERQVVLGSGNGLRGYGEYEFSGKKLLVYNLEYRIFPDLRWWIFRPGIACFYDIGTVWNDHQNISAIRFHSSTGIGLRIENIKQEGPGVIRIEFPYNFDRKRFDSIILSSQVLFSAFNDFGFISPITTGIF